MRLRYSLRNSGAAFVQAFVNLILGFVLRGVFIHNLGIAYQGLNGLFTSIISMLSIAELGIGTAITYNMYQYIAKNDQEVLKSLMHFYRNCYRVIAAIVLVIGLGIIPFLGDFSNYSGISENVDTIYLLFLANTIAGYLLAYKRSILYAYQKNYIIIISDFFRTIVITVAQLIILIYFKNFILYLASSIILTIVENLIINYIANHQFPFILETNIHKLPSNLLKNFKKQIYGMFFHQIGGFVVFGTDSMIITRFLGLSVMGMYSNYTLIVNAISTILTQVISSITASIGNLLTEKNSKASFDVYRKISFICFWAFTFSAVASFVCMRAFIDLWIGNKFILHENILLAIVLNFYVQGMRQPMSIFQNAAGIYFENRHIPIIEALTNLIFSIIFVQYFGLVGVLMGTLISTLILYGYSFPKYIYTPLFNKSVLNYVLEQTKYIILFISILGITWLTSKLLITTQNSLKDFIANALLALILPNFLIIFLFYRTKEFKFFQELVHSTIRNKG